MCSGTRNASVANHLWRETWFLASWIFSWCFEPLKGWIGPWRCLVWLCSKYLFDCRIASLGNSHWVSLLQLIDWLDFASWSPGCIRCNFHHYWLLLDLPSWPCPALEEKELLLPILLYLVELNVLTYKLSSISFSNAERCFAFPRLIAFEIGWRRQQCSSPATSASRHSRQPDLYQFLPGWASSLAQPHCNHSSSTSQIPTSADSLSWSDL